MTRWGPNTSSAVMQQRVEPHDSLDFFPTPPWATRALCERLTVLSPLHLQSVWEPACGEGDMARPLGEFFDQVYATDVHDYSAAFPAQDSVCNFLCEWDHPSDFQDDEQWPDWVVTNPPFRLGKEFIRMALTRARVGVAVFVRTAFLEGKERFRSLFSSTPPALVLQFVERVSLVKGRLDEHASRPTSYCWIVWLVEGAVVTAFDWIAPCRPRLEKPEDYPAPPSEPTPAPLLDGLVPPS
ncbi:MAG: SAM-dependent DNA methyltransferase [Pseudomonadota bacterium]